MTNFRLQYGSDTLAVDASELQGSALRIIVNDYVANLNPLRGLAPTLRALEAISYPQDIVRWNVQTGEGTASNAPLETAALYSGFPGGVDNTVYQGSSTMAAEITWGKNKTYNMIEINTTEAAVARARGINAVRNLYGSRVAVAVDGILNKLNNDIYTGTLNGSGNIYGFDALFADTEYANIVHTLPDYTGTTPNVEYFPEWRPLQGNANLAGANLTLNDGYGAGATLVNATSDTIRIRDNNRSTVNETDALYAFMFQLARIKGRTVNAIVMNPQMAQILEINYAAKLNWNIDNGQVVSANENTGALQFFGRPVIEDSICPADTIYFLDTSRIKVLTMPDALGNSSFQSRFNIYGGALARESVTVDRYELLCVPGMLYEDTRAISRLVIS